MQVTGGATINPSILQANDSGTIAFGGVVSTAVSYNTICYDINATGNGRIKPRRMFIAYDPNSNISGLVKLNV